MYFKAIFSSLVFLSLVSCSARTPKVDSFYGQGMKVGKVEVIADKQAMDSERLNVLDKLNGENVLRLKIIELLRQNQLHDPSSQITLTLKINDFRLRHGATRYFTGIYSGSDHLFAKMTLTDKGSELLNHEIKASGGNGNPFNISRDSRGEGLFVGTSKLVLNALRSERIVKSR